MSHLWPLGSLGATTKTRKLQIICEQQGNQREVSPIWEEEASQETKGIIKKMPGWRQIKTKPLTFGCLGNTLQQLSQNLYIQFNQSENNSTIIFKQKNIDTYFNTF